jgi:hypothetical protein
MNLVLKEGKQEHGRMLKTTNASYRPYTEYDGTCSYRIAKV